MPIKFSDLITKVSCLGPVKGVVDKFRTPKLFRPMNERVPGLLIRAARQLVGMSQPELARRSGSSLSSVVRIEGGAGKHNEATREKLVETLQRAGVRFIPTSLEEGAGVRWASPEAEHSSIGQNLKTKTKPKKTDAKPC